MPSLVDQFCPNVHDCTVTAAAYDPVSGTIASADESGMIAVQRKGETTPGLVFRPGGPIHGALGLIQGGSLLAVGDDNGSVGVYYTDSGQPLFREEREGENGRVRAMRGIAINPEGTRIAAIAIDGLLRIWDIQRRVREVTWQDFSGCSVEFDPRGERLLCMDGQGQPRLVDLISQKGIPLDRLQMPAERACFSRDGTRVIAVGASGISLLQVVDGRLVGSYATRGGSGILSLVLSPQGDQAAVITLRSTHVFSIPTLEPLGSSRHGVTDPSGASIWTFSGIRVGGGGGLMQGGGAPSLGPVNVTMGFGNIRLAAHNDVVAVWENNTRRLEFPVGAPVREMMVDRDGRLLVVLPKRGPVQVFELQSGQPIFDGGPATEGALGVDVGGAVVSVRLSSGGTRWWHLARGQAFDLGWPLNATLSGGGTWLGVITPRGLIRILDPSTGQDALPSPKPLANVPVRLLAFVNRRPELLILDAEGVLGHYDLAQGIRQNNAPAQGREILRFDVEVDHIWGITGGKVVALRLPQGDRSSIVVVETQTSEVIHQQIDLHPKAWVDEETGHILEPARSGAILERDLRGDELRVLRTLPGGEWIAFGPRGIFEASEGAGSAMNH